MVSKHIFAINILFVEMFKREIIQIDIDSRLKGCSKLCYFLFYLHFVITHAVLENRYCNQNNIGGILNK